MNRRDSIKTLALDAGMAAWPTLAHATQPLQDIVFDQRFDACRMFAASGTVAFDCSEDAARLWFSTLARRALSGEGNRKYQLSY